VSDDNIEREFHVLAAAWTYRCPDCGERLYTQCGPHTRWQQWLFTGDGRRHYRRWCNLTAGSTVQEQS